MSALARHCRRCEAPFYPSRRTQKYCSRGCASRQAQARFEAARRPEDAWLKRAASLRLTSGRSRVKPLRPPGDASG